MFKVSDVPPRRSAMLTVFRGATAINDGTTAEPLRPWRCNYGLCRTSTAVAPRLRCDGGRRSAVMTILRDATAINDGTTAIMAVSLRNHGDSCGATAVYAVQAPQWYRASGVTGVLVACARWRIANFAASPESDRDAQSRLLLVEQLFTLWSCRVVRQRRGVTLHDSTHNGFLQIMHPRTFLVKNPSDAKLASLSVFRKWPVSMATIAKIGNY